MVKSREITTVTFSPKQLLKIHKLHRDFIISSARACNQLNYWRTYAMFEHTDGNLGYPELPFVLNRITSQVFITISSIIEYNRLAKRYLGETKKIFPDFGRNLRDRFAPIAREISRFPIVNRIRNKSIFHFDDVDYTETINSFPENHEFQFLHGDRSIEFVFPFANEIVLKSHNIQEKSKESNFLSLSIKTSTDIVEFHCLIMLKIFEQNGIMSDVKKIQSRESTVGDAQSCRIPVFVDLESASRRLEEFRK